MKRSIKFRGLDYKNNWMFGTYYFGVMYPTSFEGHYINDTMINPETIGQFTGLKDRNGTEIYEGDIVSWKDEIVTVKWENQAAAFWMNWKRISKNTNKEQHCYEFMQANYGDDTGYYEMNSVEVIGNIHEHPELLK